jgi:large subunit ribosomal protein L9
MNVILKQDMPNLGHKDDIVAVKDGYARNYLIPKGFAINATAQNKRCTRKFFVSAPTKRHR